MSPEYGKTGAVKQILALIFTEMPFSQNIFFMYNGVADIFIV